MKNLILLTMTLLSGVVARADVIRGAAPSPDDRLKYVKVMSPFIDDFSAADDVFFLRDVFKDQKKNFRITESSAMPEVLDAERHVVIAKTQALKKRVDAWQAEREKGGLGSGEEEISPYSGSAGCRPDSEWPECYGVRNYQDWGKYDLIHISTHGDIESDYSMMNTRWSMGEKEDPHKSDPQSGLLSNGFFVLGNTYTRPVFLAAPFFQQQAQRWQGQKLIVLSGCNMAQKPDLMLALANRRRNGVIGFDEVIQSGQARVFMERFYGYLLETGLTSENYVDFVGRGVFVGFTKSGLPVRVYHRGQGMRIREIVRLLRVGHGDKNIADPQEMRKNDAPQVFTKDGKKKVKVWAEIVGQHEQVPETKFSISLELKRAGAKKPWVKAGSQPLPAIENKAKFKITPKYQGSTIAGGEAYGYRFPLEFDLPTGFDTVGDIAEIRLKTTLPESDAVADAGANLLPFAPPTTPGLFDKLSNYNGYSVHRVKCRGGAKARGASQTQAAVGHVKRPDDGQTEIEGRYYAFGSVADQSQAARVVKSEDKGEIVGVQIGGMTIGGTNPGGNPTQQNLTNAEAMNAMMQQAMAQSLESLPPAERAQAEKIMREMGGAAKTGSQGGGMTAQKLSATDQKLRATLLERLAVEWDMVGAPVETVALMARLEQQPLTEAILTKITRGLNVDNARAKRIILLPSDDNPLAVMGVGTGVAGGDEDGIGAGGLGGLLSGIGGLPPGFDPMKMPGAPTQAQADAIVNSALNGKVTETKWKNWPHWEEVTGEEFEHFNFVNHSYKFYGNAVPESPTVGGVANADVRIRVGENGDWVEYVGDVGARIHRTDMAQEGGVMYFTSVADSKFQDVKALIVPATAGGKYRLVAELSGVVVNLKKGITQLAISGGHMVFERPAPTAAQPNPAISGTRLSADWELVRREWLEENTTSAEGEKLGTPEKPLRFERIFEVTPAPKGYERELHVSTDVQLYVSHNSEQAMQVNGVMMGELPDKAKRSHTQFQLKFTLEPVD